MSVIPMMLGVATMEIDGAEAPKSGEGAAEDVASVVERYREPMVAYAARVLGGDLSEAEDIAQEALLRAPTARRRQDIRSLPAYLHAICYRLAVDRLRARKRHARALAERAEGQEEGRTASGEAARLEEGQRLRGAVLALEDPYRTAVRLRYLEGLDFEEVAARMGTIERTARTWVGRGLAKLRETLGAGS